MDKYLFIESRDPFESLDTRFVEETAMALIKQGQEVMVFLVQNGVMAARRNGRNPYLDRLVEAGVTLLADDFSLSERGIRPEDLRPGIIPSGIEALVEALVREDTKVIWH